MMQVVINFLVGWFLLSVPAGMFMLWFLFSKKEQVEEIEVQYHPLYQRQQNFSVIAYQLEEVA